MGGSSSAPAPEPAQAAKKECVGEACPLPEKPKKLKACCACPETKMARDTW